MQKTIKAEVVKKATTDKQKNNIVSKADLYDAYELTKRRSVRFENLAFCGSIYNSHHPEQPKIGNNKNRGVE